MSKFCTSCGNELNEKAIVCPKCGVPQPGSVTAKNKVVAGLLALFLGGFGIHKFYLGKIGQGILYLLLCWTFIPAFIAFIEGIIYLCMTEERFTLQYGVK